MEYFELITLSVITFSVAHYAKCTNAKCNKLIVLAQSVYNSQFHDGFADAEMEKKDNIFNYLTAKLTEIIYTTKLKSHEIF